MNREERSSPGTWDLVGQTEYRMRSSLASWSKSVPRSLVQEQEQLSGGLKDTNQKLKCQQNIRFLLIKSVRICEISYILSFPESHGLPGGGRSWSQGPWIASILDEGPTVRSRSPCLIVSSVGTPMKQFSSPFKRAQKSDHAAEGAIT